MYMSPEKGNCFWMQAQHSWKVHERFSKTIQQSAIRQGKAIILGIGSYSNFHDGRKIKPSTPIFDLPSSTSRQAANLQRQMSLIHCQKSTNSHAKCNSYLIQWTLFRCWNKATSSVLLDVVYKICNLRLYSPPKILVVFTAGPWSIHWAFTKRNRGQRCPYSGILSTFLKVSCLRKL